MEWFFGALLFVPMILLAFVIMRVDLLLHFLGKDKDRGDQPGDGRDSADDGRG